MAVRQRGFCTTPILRYIESLYFRQNTLNRARPLAAVNEIWDIYIN